MVYLGDMKDACTSYIREIAVQPETATNVVIGGFDQKLNFLDLNRPDNPYVQRLDMESVIGSIKWAPFHGRQWSALTMRSNDTWAVVVPGTHQFI